MADPNATAFVNVTSGYSPYTTHPDQGSFVVFPNHPYQVLSNCIHILGASIVAYCLARRTESLSFWSPRSGWSSVTWTKFCVVLLFIDSWIFLVSSGVLINGVGLSTSNHVCSSAVFTCIVFYCASKVLIYLFLITATAQDARAVLQLAQLQLERMSVLQYGEGRVFAWEERSSGFNCTSACTFITTTRG